MNIVRTLPFRIARLVAVVVLTLLFMVSTAPGTLPALLLVVPFMGIFTILFLIVSEVIRFLGPDGDAGTAVVRFRRPQLMAGVIAGFPVLLLVLQSIVELTLWDVLIALAILLLTYLYLSRSTVSLWKRS